MAVVVKDGQRQALPLLAVYAVVWAGALVHGVARVGSVIALACYTLYALAFLAGRRWPKQARWVLRYAGGFVMIVVYAQHIATQARPWNPNIMANLLLLTVPFGYQNGWMWWWWGTFALAFTGSRGGMAAAVLAIATLLNFTVDGERLKSRLRWVYVIPAVLAFSVGLLLLVLWQRPNNVLNIRLPDYIGAARAFLANPLMGSGPWSHRVDSLPLTVAAEYGLTGLFPWALLAVTALHQVLTTRGNPARLAFTAWLFHQAFDNTLWDVISSSVAAVVLALLLYGGENGVGCNTDGGIERAARSVEHVPGSAIGEFGGAE